MITEDPITPRLKKMGDKLDSAMAAVTELHAPKVQASARMNAPWKDRTSNARNGLFAEPVHERLKHSIVLFHSVPYGIWLEVRWSGRYAIIVPTIQSEGPKVMRTMSTVMKRLN